jgi:hypothetical protein
MAIGKAPLTSGVLDRNREHYCKNLYVTTTCYWLNRAASAMWPLHVQDVQLKLIHISPPSVQTYTKVHWSTDTVVSYAGSLLMSSLLRITVDNGRGDLTRAQN